VEVVDEEEKKIIDCLEKVCKVEVTVNLFLCSSTNNLENQLLPNDLIIVRNHRDDEEDEQDIKRVLEKHGDAHIKVKIQSNSEF
jgi:riboflavin synthase